MKKTVLIVEDDLNIRENFRDFFLMEGFSVKTAVNGQDGLNQVKILPHPNLVLLDMLMPVMTGQEFLKELTADAALSKIPVILVSATADQLDFDGPVAYVKKPVDIDELLSLVHKFAT